MSVMRPAWILASCFCFVSLPAAVAAQPAEAPLDESQPGESRGLMLTDSDRLKIDIRFMAGFGHDESHYDIGLESQGRVGYAIVGLSGRLNDAFAYRFEFNPVDETQPLPSCGEEHFFYPNVPQAFGPNVACDNDGRLRVDDYRFVALDLHNQQGLIRQAYVSYRSSSGTVQGRFGRFILPVGFDAEEVGSFTAKDATHIQRINAESSFGMMLSLQGRLADIHLAAFLGEGNRFHDYDYFYSLDWSFDTNSAVTGLFSATVRPAPNVELRAAQKIGFTGSKVERLPNFYASKRNDRATVVSARYRALPNVSLFGEFASYTWGLARTSAELIGLPDTDPVRKNGYYGGADVHVPISRSIVLGTTVTREELDRDDALIKYLALQDLFEVKTGEKERSTVVRVYLRFNRLVTLAAYRNSLDNPFPWVSGIVPVEGPRAFQGRGNNKWGIVVRFATP